MMKNSLLKSNKNYNNFSFNFFINKKIFDVKGDNFKWAIKVIIKNYLFL